MGDTDGRRRETARAYDTVAETYEERFVDELRHRPRDRDLLDALARRGSGPVIDLGCGPGQVGAHIRDHGRTVFGVDLSSRMAARASTRLDGAVVAEIVALPVASSSVGDAVAFYSLIHLRRAEVAEALSELARVLVPGGQVAIAVHEGEGEVHASELLGHDVNVDATFFSVEELRAAATRVGFRVQLAERRPPYGNEGVTVRIHLICEVPESVLLGEL